MRLEILFAAGALLATQVAAAPHFCGMLGEAGCQRLRTSIVCEHCGPGIPYISQKSAEDKGWIFGDDGRGTYCAGNIYMNDQWQVAQVDRGGTVQLGRGADCTQCDMCADRRKQYAHPRNGTMMWPLDVKEPQVPTGGP